MKKMLCALIGVCMMVTVGWGQTASSVCTLDSCPGGASSSIELLRKGLRSSSNQIQGAASTVAPKNQVSKPAEQTAQESVKTAQTSSFASSKQAQAASSPAAAPANSAAQAAVTAADSTASPAAVQAISTKGNTLDMPLPVGGTVQSVQTTVAPAQPSKKLSPSVAKRVEEAKKKKEEAAPVPTEVERAIETENSLLPPSSKADVQAAAAEQAAPKNPQEEAAEAELEYAVKMLEQSKEKAASSGRRIQPSVSKNLPSEVPAPNKVFNPNAYRPGVQWQASKSNHFDIYTQKRTEGIPSSNLSMTFESAYQTLRRFIPWMMSKRVRVFVYQDRASYLRYEPNAIAWSRAVAYPTRGEIVVYDEPQKTQELKESFTHELTHIFTQQFFDSHQTGRLMTPLWLDEGLAVMMEDQAYNGSKGGPWANDFNTLNFQRKPASTTGGGFSTSAMFSSSSKRPPQRGIKRRGKPIFFVPFEDFMREDSLQQADGRGKTQDWYFQAYTMVRFLLNPSGSATPSNRMQFEQFTRFLSQGEPKRNPSTGFLVKDKNGKTVYEPYSVEKAFGKVYHYNTTANFEDNFWRWADKR